MRRGLVLRGRCVRRLQVTGQGTGKKRWAVTTHEVTAPADPEMTAG
jgi:hypothetical protein